MWCYVTHAHYTYMYMTISLVYHIVVYLYVLLSEIKSFGNISPLLQVGELVLQELFLQVEKLLGSEYCPRLLYHTPFGGIRRTSFCDCHSVGQ